jgi:hypothetical protein
VNIFIAFAVLLFFIVITLAVKNNIIPSNIVSAYGILIETPFEDNFQHNNNNNFSDNAKEQKKKRINL